MISVHFVLGLRTYLCEVPKRIKGPTKAYRRHEHLNYSVVRKIGSQNQFMKHALYRSVPAPKKHIGPSIFTRQSGYRKDW